MDSTLTRNASAWGPDSTSWRLAAVAGGGLISLGAFGLTRPRAAAAAFGMRHDVPRDLTAWRPKAIRDLATGLMTFALLARGDIRAMRAFAFTCALIPASDAVIVAVGGSRNPWQVAVHAVTCAGVIALAQSLHQDDQEEKPSPLRSIQ